MLADTAGGTKRWHHYKYPCKRSAHAQRPGLDRAKPSQHRVAANVESTTKARGLMQKVTKAVWPNAGLRNVKAKIGPSTLAMQHK